VARGPTGKRGQEARAGYGAPPRLPACAPGLLGDPVARPRAGARVRSRRPILRRERAAGGAQRVSVIVAWPL
jgi:hypothetical protein